MSEVRKSDVVEVIHGIAVRDPYRWLEDRQDPDTHAWITRQHQICASYFSENRFSTRLRQIVSDTLSVEVIDRAARVGHNLFLRKQLKGEEQAGIWVRNDGSMEDRLLVDPATLCANTSVDILRISSDGLLLAYSARTSGSDASEIQFADVTTGARLPECLPQSYGRGLIFDAQARGFYYCTEPTDGAVELSIRHHQIGTSISEDISVFSVPWSKYRRLTVFSSGKTIAAAITNLIGEDKVQDIYTMTEGGSVAWNPLIQGLHGRKWPILVGGRTFIFDKDDASNGRLIELLDESGVFRVVVPENPDVSQNFSSVHGGFLSIYRIDGHPRIERWSCDGQFLGALALPPAGSLEVLPLCEDGTSSFFFLHETYTDAPKLWEVDLSQERWWDPVLLTVTEERSRAIVFDHTFIARDGTELPIVLIEPAEKRTTLAKHVLLTAYGGFGISELPRFSRMAKILAGLGVTIARPSIRGGSERGEKWHQAATRQKHQTAIDDFIAAAEWLISEGITDEQHLAITGSSSGGLLVAAAIVQRPSLFTAAVCTGPLTDMVRYERFDQAWQWRTEYGTVEDAQDFKALFAYSPYHNVKDAVDYPAVLFVTGDADDRCNPAHVRKMAAVLQEREVQSHPIIVDYMQSWGHVATLSLTERVDALTRKLSFLCDLLNIDISEERSSQ